MTLKMVLSTISIGLLAMGNFSVCLAEPVIADGWLTTKSKHSLYVFDNDVVGSGKSVCYAPCSNIFPPYLAEDQESAKAPFDLIDREDGGKQWTYKGRPLYKFYIDEKPGDKGGDGVNRNHWHLAQE